MSKVRLYSLFIGMVFLALVAVLGGSATVAAAEAERGISLSTTYTSITIAKNQNVTLPIKVANLGKVDEQVSIEISSAPQGWVADLVNEETVSFEVRSLHLAIEEARLIYFRAKPPAGIKSGDYSFLVEAVSKDKLVKSSLEITIGIEEQATVLSRVNLMATYPDLRGPADGSSFEFTVSVTNEGSEDHTFSFSAEAPPRWEVSFSPAYEQRQIATIGVKAGKTEDIKVALIPPNNALAGTYITKIKATSGDIEGTMNLTVTLQEVERELTHELQLLPTTGRLDIEATAGQVSSLSVLVTNRGSGDLESIRFFANKPEGWLVTFTPEIIGSLSPGEEQEVSAFITPTSKTIAGDYSLTVRANATGVADSIDLRVRVGQSTIWGWVGLVIVLVVIAGMVTLFWRLGRR